MVPQKDAGLFELFVGLLGEADHQSDIAEDAMLCHLFEHLGGALRPVGLAHSLEHRRGCRLHAETQQGAARPAQLRQQLCGHLAQCGVAGPLDFQPALDDPIAHLLQSREVAVDGQIVELEPVHPPASNVVLQLLRDAKTLSGSDLSPEWIVSAEAATACASPAQQHGHRTATARIPIHVKQVVGGPGAVCQSQGRARNKDLISGHAQGAGHTL